MDWTPLGGGSAAPGQVDDDDYSAIVFNGGWGSASDGSGVAHNNDFLTWQRSFGAADPTRTR